jgi:hypothetical protein
MTAATDVRMDARRSSRFEGISPVLFAAYAVLFLWSQNLGETHPRQVLIPLVAVILAAALLTLLLGALFRDRRRGALVAAPIVIGLLMYGHAADLVGRLHVPGILQQAGWVALVVIAIIAAIRLDERWIARLDTALGRIAAILVLVTLVLIIPYVATNVMSGAASPRVEPASDSTTTQKRDVYWLVFDRYGSDRSLELQYGVKNDLTPWLEEHGFTVLPDSHANYIRTALSMASTLRMAPLDDIAAAAGAGNSDMTPINDALQDPLVARQFKALGYRYHHIGSWWDPTRIDEGADVNFIPPTILGGGDFTDALFDASAFPAIAKRLRLPSESDRVRAWDTNVKALDALAATTREPGPKFVLGHILLPHPPLVFDRDGSFIDDDGVKGHTSLDMYQRQLDFTNSKIKELLSGFLDLPEAERPIVILQADEGPWPPSYSAERKTDIDWAAGATEEELEQKYGILNAWYLPGGEDLGLDPAMSAINTFPVLFSRYFGIDYPTFPDRIFSSHDWSHPYDLTDITDRLPSLR